MFNIRYDMHKRRPVCCIGPGCPPSMELAKGVVMCCPVLDDVCSTEHILVQHQHCKLTGAAGACEVEGLLDDAGDVLHVHDQEVVLGDLRLIQFTNWD